MKSKPDILLVGADGAMGKRYHGIMNYLKADHVCFDIHDDWDTVHHVKKAIVATPIATHIEICEMLLRLGVQHILCEKPISKSFEAVKDLRTLQNGGPSKIYMVNNWAFLLRTEPLAKQSNWIDWNYYNSGADGDFDLIQPIYLADGYPLIQRTSPIYHLIINKTKLSQIDFDRSYVRMIQAFLDDQFHLLWNLDEALEAIGKLLLYMGSHK
jgi:hypothetical protein